MAAGTPRVVSLLPAATDIVSALGAWELLVGISHECTVPASVAAPARVTASNVATGTSSAIDAAVRSLVSSGHDLFRFDHERVRALAPTLIVTQTLCDVCAVSEHDVRDFAESLSTPCEVATLGARTLHEVLESIQSLGARLGLADEGSELALGLAAQGEAVHRALRRARPPRPRVAVIEWTDPVFSAGHWVPDMIARAGGRDALAASGDHSRTLTPEEVREAGADVVVFAPCGFDLPRALSAAQEALGKPEWSWLRAGPVWAVNGDSLTSRPGPRLWEGVATFARLLHGDVFGAPDPAQALRVA